MGYRVCGGVSLFAITISLATSAMAQSAEPAAPPPAAAATSGEIEEIIVTAQKRSESLQRVPVAISAVNAETIEDARIEGSLDLPRIAPGVNIANSFGTVLINIRGLGTEASNFTSEASVLAYIDGVYVARPSALGAVYDDLERIEVLRGPQGTLYGRNATGGVINFITKAPEPGDGFSGNASATYGRFDRFKLNGGVNIPVGDTTAARVSFTHEEVGGDQINTVDGRRLRNLDVDALRGTLVTEPSDSFRLTARADYYKDSGRTPTYDFINGSQAPGANPVASTPFDPNGAIDFVNAGPAATPPINDGKFVSANSTPYMAHENWGGSVTADWDISPDVTLRSITAYRRSDLDRETQDFDGTDALIIEEIYGREHSKALTQELNLSGQTAGGANWVTGAYYFRERVNAAYDYHIYALGDIFQALGFGTDDQFTSTTKATTTSFSLFAQGTVPITDELKLTAGLRKNWDKKEALLFARTFGAVGCNNVKQKDKWNDITWRIALDYELSARSLVYASVSTGFKAGGLNTGFCDAEGYDPEHVTSYEVGSKNTLMNGRLLLNASAFYYDYEDMQVNIFTPLFVTTQNASTARIYGVELETRLRITDQLEVGGNVSALKAEYLNFENINPLQTGIPNVLPTDLSGRQLAHTPKRTAQGVVDYKVPVGDNELQLRYDLSHNSGWYGDPFQENVGIRQRGYTVHNARVAFDFGNYEIGGFVNNFTDKPYTENRFSFASASGVIASWAPRRTWALFLNAKF